MLSSDDRRGLRRRWSAAACFFALACSVHVAGAAGPAPGAVTSERLKIPSGPNSVRGLADEPRIDPFLAQVNYEVPIELPAGWGGLSPAVALVYSGALGNGPVGIGWSLPGVRIERSRRLGAPRFDATDELELSGIASGRLVPIGGDEYRIEGSGQTIRVRRSGGGFEVDDGNGTTSKLGVTSAARHDSVVGGVIRTFGWLVEEQRNQAGERIRYEYQHDRGQVYLSRVIWGPGDAFSVDFVYESRGDKVSSYREGFRVVTARRLAAVQVRAFGKERRAYQLRYDESFAVSRLAGIESTGLEGDGAWPALSFEYAAAAAPTVTPVPGIESWRLNVNGTTLVDLDGDGAAELLQLDNGGHKFRVNQNGSFGAVQLLGGNTQSILTLQLQDIDGDARAELLRDSNDGWMVWKYGGRNWISLADQLPRGTWPGTQGLALKNPATTRFADLNGDGIVDAIEWNNDNLMIHQGTATGFLPSRQVGRIGGVVLPSERGRFVDTNGDGLDDFVVLEIGRFDIYIGRGDGTFDPAFAVPYPFPIDRPNAETVHLADLDRDGLVDLVRVELGDVRWFRGNADGTFAQTPVVLSSPEPLTVTVVVAITDVNGNGSEDIVWSSQSGMWSMDVAGPTTAGMLVHVRNGLGMDVSFGYRSSHALSAEARQANDPWLFEVPIAMPVPVEKTIALGPGETVRKMNYKVRDGFWDVSERRFAGFLGAIVTTWGATPAETSSIQTRYHSGASPNRVLRGKVLTEQVRDGSGRRLSLTLNTWNTMAVAGLPDVPLLRSATLRETRIRYEDTTPFREARETFEYDELGRVHRITDQGRLDLDHDDSLREMHYGDDGTTWVRNRLCEEKLLGSDGVIVAHVQHIFGDEAQIHPLCTVGKGWPRETRAWLASESRFVTQADTSYDAHGNPLVVSTMGVKRNLTYDDDGLFPMSESVELENQSLTWSLTWDRVLGVATSMREPNGHETHASYDALGRLTALGLDDQTSHLVVVYDWSEPSPKTVVWEFDGALSDLTPWTGMWSSEIPWRQSIEVANGRGEVRYRAVRTAQDSWIITDYKERDPNSRVTFVGQPAHTSTLEHTSRPAGMVGNQLFYDPLGRMLEQRLPTGTRRVFSYTAFERTAEQDGLAPEHSVLDGQGRIIMTERTAPDGIREVIDARYDAAGRIIEMSLQGGQVVHTYQYDTLGRLVHAEDNDIGPRDLVYDDGDRLISATNGAGQAITYAYDAAGRLVAERADGNIAFIYHYDESHPEEAATNVKSRLAWVEEPTGYATASYDAFGRTEKTARVIDGIRAEELVRRSPSGVILGYTYDDGFAIDFAHDPASRTTGAGTLWSLEEQDAAGNVLRERFGNGVVQRYERDLLGLPSRVAVDGTDGAALYDVAIERNEWLAIESLTDHDSHGLDHTATFGYDTQGRLTAATLGQGTAAHQFGYAYDALQNMTSRHSTGPKVLGVLVGEHRYGERGHGPRQLTSIQPEGGATQEFAYDAAGRLTSRGGLSLEYDGFDQLVRVQGIPTGSGHVEHMYGYDGQRVKTVAPDGASTYWFSERTTERSGVREHIVNIGDRAIARITGSRATPATSTAPWYAGTTSRPWFGAFVTLLAAVVMLVAAAARSQRAHRVATGAALLVLTQLSCGTALEGGTARLPIWQTSEVLYFHSTVSAGPTLFTRENGSVASERRFEPFGVPIDSYIETDTGSTVGDVDFDAIDHNSLAKRTDPDTGWSYHGARWMAPDAARWLTPDPPVKGPDPKFLSRPWALHPYQYVEQNPVMFWDPDGREKGMLASNAANQICVGQGACTHAEWMFFRDTMAGKSPPPVPPHKQSTREQREAGYRASLFLLRVLPLPSAVLGASAEVIDAISTENDGPIDLKSVDPTSLTPPGPRRSGVTGSATEPGPAARGTPKLLGQAGEISGVLRRDVVLSGGRSGENVKSLVGPPNSVVRGGGQRAFVTNDKGQVILDITADRVKPVTPGVGFGPKRAPSSEELELLQQVWRP